MLVDSHCHLNFLDLTDFNQNISQVLALAEANGVQHFLSVCVELKDYPVLEQLAARFPQISISVGVHPNTEMEEPVTADLLINLAANPACIAIGETGLDYYRVLEEKDQEAQRQRFREHITAAKKMNKPLIVHTRHAADDTIKLMKQEHAYEAGGVMHCFAESLEIAKQAIDLDFYISFSGIISFKNATSLQETVKLVPLERILIETDSPYLAPVPFRGKQNHPALVKHVAEALAAIKGISYAEVAETTTNNFYRCFHLTP